MGEDGVERETWRGNLLALGCEIGGVALVVGTWFLIAWLLAGCPT